MLYVKSVKPNEIEHAYVTFGNVRSPIYIPNIARTARMERKMFRQTAQVTRRDSSVIRLSHHLLNYRKINISQSVEENVSRVTSSL